MIGTLTRHWSRRELLRRSAALTLPTIFPARLKGSRSFVPDGSRSFEPAATDGLRTGAGVYQSIGARPLINARSTFTIMSASLMLPEVRAAREAAWQHA